MQTSNNLVEIRAYRSTKLINVDTIKFIEFVNDTHSRVVLSFSNMSGAPLTYYDMRISFDKIKKLFPSFIELNAPTRRLLNISQVKTVERLSDTLTRVIMKYSYETGEPFSFFDLKMPYSKFKRIIFSDNA